MRHAGRRTPSPAALHAGFLQLLPRVERHARVAFRHVRCPHRRADAVAEVVALAWKWYVRLVRRGQDPASFVTALAAFAARAVRSGRGLTAAPAPSASACTAPGCTPSHTAGNARELPHPRS